MSGKLLLKASIEVVNVNLSLGNRRSWMHRGIVLDHDTGGDGRASLVHSEAKPCCLPVPSQAHDQAPGRPLANQHHSTNSWCEMSLV